MAIDLPDQLTELRRLMLTMGALVEQRVYRAVEALVKTDLDAAREVRSGDQEIDQMEVDAEQECLRILALSHPVAGDLRFVLAALRIASDLERIGDYAKGVAKRVIALNDLPSIQCPSALVEMSKAAPRMFSDTMASMANSDLRLARSIRPADSRVDDLQKEVVAWVRESVPKRPEMTDSAIHILSLARQFERIADISTRISEDVIFLIEGSVVRHVPA